MKNNLTNKNNGDRIFRKQHKPVGKSTAGHIDFLEDKLFEEWKNFTPEKEMGDEESDHILNSVLDEIDEADPKSSKISLNRKKYVWISGIAASFLILVGLTFSYSFLKKTINPGQTDHFVAINVAPGETREITLPDGSIVLLNSQSTLRYKESFNHTNRELVLQGEAFFKVVKDSINAFVVKTGSVRTRVYGTRFNVTAYDGENNIVVAVEEGKVEVFDTAKYGSSVFLTQQQKAICNTQSRTIQKLHTDETNGDFAWLKGGIVFDDLPLHDALRRLKREYNVNFILTDPALGNCTINGSFFNEDIYSIIKMMSMSIDFEFDVDSNQRLITIHGNGCNAQ